MCVCIHSPLVSFPDNDCTVFYYQDGNSVKERERDASVNSLLPSCCTMATTRRGGGGSLWLQDLSVGSVTFVGSLRPVSFRVASCVVYVKNKLISQVRSFFPCLFPVFFACLCAAAAMCRKGGMTLDRPTGQTNTSAHRQTSFRKIVCPMKMAWRHGLLPEMRTNLPNDVITARRAVVGTVSLLVLAWGIEKDDSPTRVECISSEEIVSNGRRWHLSNLPSKTTRQRPYCYNRLKMVHLS